VPSSRMRVVKDDGSCSSNRMPLHYPRYYEAPRLSAPRVRPPRRRRRHPRQAPLRHGAASSGPTSGRSIDYQWNADPLRLMLHSSPDVHCYTCSVCCRGITSCELLLGSLLTRLTLFSLHGAFAVLDTNHPAAPWCNVLRFETYFWYECRISLLLQLNGTSCGGLACVPPALINVHPTFRMFSNPPFFFASQTQNLPYRWRHADES
jgi:hypothetical protein